MAQSDKNYEKKKSQAIARRLRTRTTKAWGSTGSGGKNFLDFHT